MKKIILILDPKQRARIMNYNDEDADELRSTFTTYLAEGDKVCVTQINVVDQLQDTLFFQLFSNGEFKKALEAYTKALMLKPGDKSCLVARSKCYLHIGDPESALKVSEIW